MASDVRLSDTAVIVDGPLGVNTDNPDAALQVEGEAHCSGGSAGLRLDSRRPGTGGNAGGNTWVSYADLGALRFWAGGDWMTLFPNGTLSSYHYVIGSHAPSRGIDVQAGVHARGGDAGFSFADRGAPLAEYSGKPDNGQRWEWYCEHGQARLWSGTDKLTVSAQGYVTVGSFTLGQASKLYVYTGALKFFDPKKPTAGGPVTLDLVAKVFELENRIAALEKK